MQNFTYYNPTRIVFGRGQIAELAKLVPSNAKSLILYGGGSIKKNGVYEQVQQALAGRNLSEFGGIEPNPHYETCMKAVELMLNEKLDFIVAVGGGSVLDASKFIAASTTLLSQDPSFDPWSLMGNGSKVLPETIPIGSVLTLPATGSEMNGSSVITNVAKKQKNFFGSPYVYPRFSILDPETTFTLPARQTANGVVDAFVHVMEQYMTYDVNAPLQDRQAEAILTTLIELGPQVLARPNDYDLRANMMWCATNALNGLIACGVPQDWSTHMIGHELTALYGLDHAQTLALVLPGTLRHMRKGKWSKLLQYGSRVWGIHEGTEEERVEQAIARTDAFFRSLGVGTRFSDYNLPGEASELVAERLSAAKRPLGEKGNMRPRDVQAILASRV